MAKPRLITLKVDTVSTYDFEGTLQSTLERIQELIAEHGPEARLDYNKYFYYEYDNEPTPQYEVIIQREETKEEEKARMAKEREIKSSQEARDKAEFERLSKKFGTK